MTAEEQRAALLSAWNQYCGAGDALFADQLDGLLDAIRLEEREACASLAESITIPPDATPFEIAERTAWVIRARKP